jgi:tryptophan synthase alpha chain
MSGIDDLAASLAVPRPPALMCHAVCGFPDFEASRAIFAAAVRGGADIIEAQLPYSEPSADGPLIAWANHVALEAFAARGGRGAKLRIGACLELLGELRRETGKSVLVMSYINPIFAYGVTAIVREASQRGLAGFIVPDYPDDEPELDLARLCSEAGLALVPLIAPTTPIERAASLAAASNSPLLYVILRVGVTGRRTELDPAAIARLADIRSRTGKKVAAGFGLRDRSQIEALRESVDCAVVGSALLAAAKAAIEAGNDPATAVAAAVAAISGRRVGS